MEIVSSQAPPVLPPDVARETLLDLAAVVRTLFGVGLRSTDTPPAPATPVASVTPVAAASAPVVAPAASRAPAPALPVPSVPATAPSAVRAAPPAALRVPSLPVPSVPDAPDGSGREDGLPVDPSGDRLSLAMLQEIAFLDD